MCKRGDVRLTREHFPSANEQEFARSSANRFTWPNCPADKRPKPFFHPTIRLCKRPLGGVVVVGCYRQKVATIIFNGDMHMALQIVTLTGSDNL